MHAKDVKRNLQMQQEQNAYRHHVQYAQMYLRTLSLLEDLKHCAEVGEPNGADIGQLAHVNATLQELVDLYQS